MKWITRTKEKPGPCLPSADDGHTSSPSATSSEPVSTARELGVTACHMCGFVNQAHPEGEEGRCTRCQSPLHRRKVAGTERSWAFLIAAMVCYFPANLLIFMNTDSIQGNQSDTILSGIIYLWMNGSHGLAIVVLTASFIVPLLKMLIMAMLLIAVQRRKVQHGQQYTQLYRVVEVIGRWSMLDIFVMALLSALVQAGVLATVTPGKGAIAFGAVVVFTMLSSRSFDPRLLWDFKKDQSHE